VGDYFAAADAAVLPYRDATGSAVAAQALAAGLPVVASAIGGLAETVCDGENGLLVPAGDAAALAAALARLADVALRAHLSAGARSWAERCTWTSYVDMLEALVARTSAGA
jgi:glycosyltransferase involved in cell wall biosynthesis